MGRRTLPVALACLLAVPVAAEAPRPAPREPVVAVAFDLSAPLRPRARPTDDRRCTADGDLCIATATYATDVCRMIETAAAAHGLAPGFLARLLWRESLFDAGAVSPAGAQGIAQFIPATAERRGLSDPFNPAEAILASAAYLKHLEGRFGNLGLAAAAYNGGEERVSRYLSGDGGLPGETRAYVAAITGHRADEWRDGPTPAPDLSLDADRPFHDACVDKASARRMPSFEPDLLPWAVILAGRDSAEAAEQEARQVVDRHGDLLGGERIDLTRERFPGMQAARHFAQVGRQTRAEALALCTHLRSSGTGCIVRRNG